MLLVIKELEDLKSVFYRPGGKSGSILGKVNKRSLTGVAFLGKIPWVSLVLLLISFALLGWYLSSYHSIWSLWSFVAVVAVTMAIIWSSDSLLRWLRVGSQGLFFALGITLVACLAVLASGLFTQVVMLLAAELLARIQMQSAGFSKNHTLWVLTVVVGLGLGLGWMTGTMFLPEEEEISLIQLSYQLLSSLCLT